MMIFFKRKARQLSGSNLPQVPKLKYYPLSFQQRRVHFITQFNPEGAAMWNNHHFEVINDSINVAALNKAFSQLIQRHASLRTRIILNGNEPVQQIVNSVDPKIGFIDLSKIEASARNAEAKRILEEESLKIFNLSEASFCRLLIIRLQEKENVLFLNIHHIVSDATSIFIFKSELNALYSAYKNNDTPQLPEITRHYNEFCHWQRSHFQENSNTPAEAYWLDQFKDENPVLELPLDFSRKEIRSYEGKSHGYGLEPELLAKINEYCRNNLVTNLIYYLSALAILLYRYTSQKDLIIGTHFKGRDKFDELKNMIGFFINTLPFRIAVDSDKTYAELMRQVQKQVMKSFKHQDYPFDNLIRKIKIDRSLNRNPLFDVLINYMPGDKLADPKSEGVLIDLEEKRILENDLTFNIIYNPEVVYIRIDYLTSLFKAESIYRMMRHYKKILNDIVNTPNSKISENEILLEDEKEYLLETLNQTAIPYPSAKLLHEFFEEQVLRTPDEPALYFGESQMTFRELNSKANQLALYLREKGVKADSIVGMMMERSFEMMIAIFGILKAGGAYLPIDPKYPKDRVNYMIGDSEMKLLLVNKEPAVSIDVAEIIDLKSFAFKAFEEPNPERLATPNSLAYVMYTSGSTGNPKGVMTEHHSIINRMTWGHRTYRVGAGNKVLQKTAYTFDVSIWELFCWTFEGGRLCFLEPDGEKDPRVILESIFRWQITHIHFVPSMLTIFLEYLQANKDQQVKLKSLQHVFTTGEPLVYKCVMDFKEILYNLYNTKLTNLYGPTEAAIEVSNYDVLPGEVSSRIPIGKPIDNTQLYVLNENLKPVPVGVRGELYISGVNLARGYLKRVELTNERFIDNPFIKGAKMYKTGDIVRYLPDGNIDYIQRVDHQIKIRGNRVELGEIENTLNKHESIKESIAITKEFKKNDVRIIAFFTSNEKVSTLKLRSFLREFLPDYMIPSQFIQIEKFTVTANGKMDKKALEKYIQNADIDRKETILPKTALQKELAEIWKKEIGLDSISLTDNFFDIGGHSLLILHVMHSMEEKYGTAPQFRDFFNQTFEQFVANFERSSTTK